MRTREIEPGRWQEFADVFSRAHDGWLVSIDVKSRAGAWSLADGVPFWGVVAEGVRHGNDVLVIVPEIEHVIHEPKSLVVEETDEGAEAALTITDRNGVRTVIEFCSPMRPELVDGAAV